MRSPSRWPTAWVTWVQWTSRRWPTPSAAPMCQRLDFSTAWLRPPPGTPRDAQITPPVLAYLYAFTFSSHSCRSVGAFSPPELGSLLLSLSGLRVAAPALYIRAGAAACAHALCRSCTALPDVSTLAVACAAEHLAGRAATLDTRLLSNLTCAFAKGRRLDALQVRVDAPSPAAPLSLTRSCAHSLPPNLGPRRLMRMTGSPTPSRHPSWRGQRRHRHTLPPLPAP